MSRTDKPVPKHRGTPAEPAVKRGLRKGLLFSGIAVASTGVAVSGGVAFSGEKPDAATAALAAAHLSPSAEPTVDRDRTREVSRSDRRDDVDQTKALFLAQESGGQVTRTEELATGDPRDIARAMLIEYGWSQDQFGCLDSLWMKESGWNPRAANPSGAYGIPQALPGSKMATAGADWQYNPETQIRWGLGYIQARYGTPCGAWGHSQSVGWY
ncbi:MAG TPA: transglycosylase SLT domain-containing protein [Nocardioidaceae bacterium]|nr:transglycosylase SLT domain-containing protein [Nocardioidaceae bacterium]